MKSETSEKKRLPAVATSAKPHAAHNSPPSRLSRASVSNRRAPCDQIAATATTSTIASSTWITTAAAERVVATTSVASRRLTPAIVAGFPSQSPAPGFTVDPNEGPARGRSDHLRGPSILALDPGLLHQGPDRRDHPRGDWLPARRDRARDRLLDPRHGAGAAGGIDPADRDGLHDHDAATAHQAGHRRAPRPADGHRAGAEREHEPVGA